MNMIKPTIAALFAVAVVSCSTPPTAKPQTSGIAPSEPTVITKIEYLPGKVVVQPFPQPDSALTPDPAPLTKEYISGVDIPPEDAMDTAVAWAGQYRELATTYDVLRGWIIGVRAGQGIGIDEPPVMEPSESPTD